MLTKIQLKPGINRDATNYANSGGWFDSNFIRFRNGLPEKIGGWTRIYANQTALIGQCRKMYDWSNLAGNQYLAIPTNVKFYVDDSSSIIDISPLRRNLTLASNPIATSNTSSTITITDVNHGGTVGDYITISGATNVNGITAAQINKEFVIQSVINTSAYTVTTTGTATSTGSGGGSVVNVSYQFHKGTTSASAFSGWGSGPWGGSIGQYGWGYGPGTTFTTFYNGLWSVDNYGEDMVACPRDLTNGTLIGGVNPVSTSNTSNVVTVTQVNHGLANNIAVVIYGVESPIGGIPITQLNGTKIISVANANAYTYTTANVATSTASGGSSAISIQPSIIYWDITDPNGPAVSLGELGAAYEKKYLPYVAVEIMVSDQNRQIIAFGCNPYDVTKPQDKMVIRWCDSSDPTNWDIADTTKTAGEQRLSSGSYIVTAVQNREEILVWTDTSLFTMTPVGPPYGYGFNVVGSNFDIAGPNSKVVAGSIAYWMGTNNFYMYDGKITAMPCTVRDYVFLDFSVDDGEKVYCSSDSGNNEIIWFYPSQSQGPAGSREVDKYVVYNYIEEVWYYGNLSRTAWIDRRGHSNPRAVSDDGYLYNHESGYDDGSTSPASAINAYIESSAIEIENGDHFSFVDRVIPDITFRNSTTHPIDAQPSVTFTIKPQDYPGSQIGAGNARPVTRNSSATLNVNRFTNQLFTRLRARSVALRLESNETGVSWRLGIPRLDTRKDGRR
jgi:hypothetical protein